MVLVASFLLNIVRKSIPYVYNHSIPYTYPTRGFSMRKANAPEDFSSSIISSFFGIECRALVLAFMTNGLTLTKVSGGIRMRRVSAPVDALIR